ncbi:tannase/feruloyl esterase family alpha/beta hydrolase [Micromonospora sp. WMMD980]|uniref:tannase/feruloyl esterase family alpha/beta hydrolase n=1 Tax=Micromonospora sp. WMMD980 TaxID=3016088 RepID=UPI0024174447|nr:tannase/feruloyl esterase family alpha/beta hydrolase [Micromonospora sp. WMMD980]MDG4804167.1 tannase/feruloyl esterase family alpha/beta hydrolase [Micromonospora sp. WMMD980]
MRRTSTAVLAALAIMILPPPPSARAAPGGCAGLTRLPGVESAVADADYCDVRGTLPPHERYEIKLPLRNWTGQYVQQGCSGLCGAVPDLTLPLFGFRCAPAVDKRIVLAASDSGHTGADLGDGNWGAHDLAARIDFGLTSEHKLRVFADVVTGAFYGHGPAYRYFDGCSTGGRQGLNLAERFPTDFDGVLAGAPAHNLAPLALANAWLARKNKGDILPAAKLPVLHAAVQRACGELIEDPRTCGFQPASIRCPGADRPDCLTGEQVAVAVAAYRGPSDARRRNLYNGGFAYGSELSWNGSFVGPDPFAARIALAYFRNLAYPKNPPADFTLDDVTFTEATFDRLQVLGDAVYNATSPDLSTFRAHGGKLIVYHGWADAQISPFSTLDWYAAVERHAGGFAASQRFSRLYMIPGGYHCLFGPEVDRPSEVGVPEFLTPLMSWVERGEAPDAIDVPTITSTDPPDLVRFRTVDPSDALSPPPAAPGSLNANYHYLGG